MRTLLLGILLFSFARTGMATHMKGGFIGTRQVSGSLFVVELNLWLDMGSSVAPNPGNLFINGESIFEDVEVITEGDFIEVGGDIAYYTFTTAYTFPAPGTYEIVYTEFNRDAGIVNIENSVDVPFVVKTSVKIDPILGGNNTGPRPGPFGWGKVTKGADFYHYHSFSEPDGDSLSYHIAIPLNSDSSFVEGHQYISQYADDYYLSPYTGELQWINPNTTGKFVHAMVVREWRKVGNHDMMISESQFDIMLTVDDFIDRTNADISFSSNRCASVGQPIQLNIEAPEDAERIYISTDFPGSFLLNADLIESRSVSLDYEDNLNLVIEFLNDHTSTSIVNALKVSVADTSNHLIGTRAITVTEDCSMLPVPVITGDILDKISPIGVFPNPCRDLVKVDLSRLSGQPVEIQMYNSVGQEVYWDMLIADETILQFAVAGLPRGIYLIKVVYDKKQHTKRIVLD